MLELNNISVAYAGRQVVETVTANAAPGAFIALVGPNGSGKSSLLKAVAGLTAHTGTVNLPQARNARARALSYLAQDATAPALRSVFDIVALGRTPHIGTLSKRSDADDEQIRKSLEVCGMTDFANRAFGTLSGGEQMRVHLARTLATQASLILADEPVTALDPYYQIAVMDILAGCAAQGRTVIAALHDLALARRYAHRIWVMQDGRLYKDDGPETALDAQTLAQVFRITPDGYRL